MNIKEEKSFCDHKSGVILGSEARLSYIKDFASLIPFYLEGGGAVFLEMPVTEQSNLEPLKKSLTQAFLDSQFVMYSKLRSGWVSQWLFSQTS